MQLFDEHIEYIRVSFKVKDWGFSETIQAIFSVLLSWNKEQAMEKCSLILSTISLVRKSPIKLMC